jgi:hypothetical protein
LKEQSGDAENNPAQRQVAFGKRTCDAETGKTENDMRV